jgi:PAS domain S-box-containing protein
LYDWEYWANVDGKLEYISPSCERISGYSLQDFMDNPALIREIIVPQDIEIWDEHYCASENELKSREIQLRIQRRDGETRWNEHVCRPVIDNKDSLAGFRASNRDVTERKQSELELQGAYAEITELKEQLETESALITARGNKMQLELPQTSDHPISDFKTFEEMEHNYIFQGLKEKNWKVQGTNSAASVLGMNPNTLRARIKKLGIKKPAP